jgi:hypothetical protein
MINLMNWFGTNLQDKEVTDPTLLYNYLKGRYSDTNESRTSHLTSTLHLLGALGCHLGN